MRLAFRTAATTIELDVSARRMAPDAASDLPAEPLRAHGGRRRRRRGARRRGVAVPLHLRGSVGPGGRRAAIDRALRRACRRCETEYELWLPFTDAVELLALRADAPVAPPADRGAVRWLHHGSSISHGYRAESTTGTWPVVAALATGVELTNLAFSGSAMLDPFTARTMRDQPADLISLKVGINLVNGDAMRMRAFRPAVDGFLDTIREGHPVDTDRRGLADLLRAGRAGGRSDRAGSRRGRTSGRSPAAPKPRSPWASSRCSAIRAALARDRRSAGARRTRTSTIVDGLRLYGAADAERMPLPDNLHPGPDVQRMIGERFADQVLRPLLHGQVL